MNVTQVSAANIQFKAGKSQQIVKFISNNNHVDGNFVSALVEKIPAIENLAKANKVSQVKIASHGDNYLINTGAITSYVEKSKITDAESLYSAVKNSIWENQNPARSLGNDKNTLTLVI